jgi:hypothetical protein
MDLLPLLDHALTARQALFDPRHESAFRLIAELIPVPETRHSVCIAESIVSDDALLV